MYLTQSLHRAVQQYPDHVATIYGDRVRTHREHVDRIARLAGALRELGVAEGDRVAVLSLNSDRFQETAFALWWLGAAVNPVNARWSPREMAYSLREAGSSVLLVEDTLTPVAPRLREQWDGLTTLVHCADGPAPEGMHGYEDLISAHEPVEDLRLGGDRLAALLYTGGTTGYPKGVMISHNGMLGCCVSSLSYSGACQSGGRVVHVAPLFHGAGLVFMIQQSVMGGSHVHLPGFDPVALLAAIHDHRPRTLLLVPAMIQMLVDHPSIGDYDLSSVQRVLYGASPISQALLERAMSALPQAEFIQAYGQSELSGGVTMLLPEEHKNPRLLRSAGRALPSAEIRIVDQDGNEVPPETPGEIVARSAGMMLGYWKKPEETAEAMIGGWMHTGDVGYLDKDGYLYVVDRKKDMIVSGAENVYSAEVENALEQHPAVASCAVIGVPDEKWGERVHAVVVLQPGRTATAEEIRDHCRSLIAAYKAPRTVEFVESLPLSAAGKILKRELRKPYWEKAERAVH